MQSKFWIVWISRILVSFFMTIKRNHNISSSSPNVHAVTNLLHFLAFSITFSLLWFQMPELISLQCYCWDWSAEFWPDNDHEMNFNMKDDLTSWNALISHQISILERSLSFFKDIFSWAFLFLLKSDHLEVFYCL